jgi:hypothetical protein
MGKREPQKHLTDIVAEFAEHLKQSEFSPASIQSYTATARRFIEHVASERVDRIGEAETRQFFDRYKTANQRRQRAMHVSAFLKFAMRGLPAVLNAPPAQPPTKKDLALRAKWTLDKLITEKEKADDLIALLARKLIDHYMYFERRIKGEPEDLDEIARFADEARELIQGNLALFMQMSAQGRNVHTLIDERVQP